MEKLFSLILILFVSYASRATTYYLSPQGSDSNSGTSRDVPFLSLDKALTKVYAGDTILVQGGIYHLSNTITIGKSGTANKKIHLLAYSGEKPVFDFSGTTFGKRGISLTGSYWIIKGLTITLAGDNGMIISGGSFNVIENCTFSENKDSGLQLGGGAHENRIINCDSYYNADPSDYGDADGFAPKMDTGTNNYFYGCRSWLNVDDGWDGYLRGTDNVTTILENCWTWGNGYFKDWSDAGANANGNGFKMGGSDDKTLQHHFILRNCLAFDNKAKGFDQNNNKGSMTIFNGTGFRNKGNDFSIPSGLAAGRTATIKNSLLAQGKVSLGTFVVQESNSWNGGFTVTASDFLSLDTAGVAGPRKPDGSLPDLPFVHLAPGSDLIDAGVNVGLPFKGSKPDLGCFESDETVGISVPAFEKPLLFDLIASSTDRNNLEIRFRPEVNGPVNCELWNSGGSRVRKSVHNCTVKVNERIQIDTSDLPPGIYLIRLSSKDRSQGVKIILH